jgi:2,4-dienoyl-CoA reductase-like NADH-dependent reductase (Old Yellow Enzyme family)
MPSSLSDPLTLTRGPAWANRIALAPLTNTQSHDDGTLSDDELAWLTARGRGGFGLTMTCAAHVSAAGQAWRGQLGIASEAHLPGLTRLADRLRETGTRSSVQLHHAGRRADPAVTGLPLQCPWAPEESTPAMTIAEVEQAVADFGAAAARAEQAGFDGVEVHGAHGYLVGQFLDGRHNHRTDGYGGTLDERARFLVEVLTAVRGATGADFQVGLRLTPEGNGITVEEGREIARRVLASGLVDYLDMSLWDVFMHPRSGGDQLLIDHFVDLSRHGTRLGVAGRVLSAEDVAWCLERGADFVSVGIGGILHHDWASRAVAEPDFTARERPVPAAVLQAEHVSPTFIDYLSRGWDNFVAAEEQPAR